VCEVRDGRTDGEELRTRKDGISLNGGCGSAGGSSGGDGGWPGDDGTPRSDEPGSASDSDGGDPGGPVSLGQRASVEDRVETMLMIWA
jgi:hypothetical protein